MLIKKIWIIFEHDQSKNKYFTKPSRGYNNMMNYACIRLNCNRDNEIITLMQRFTIIETHTHRLELVLLNTEDKDEEEDRYR